MLKFMPRISFRRFTRRNIFLFTLFTLMWFILVRAMMYPSIEEPQGHPMIVSSITPPFATRPADPDATQSAKLAYNTNPTLTPYPTAISPTNEPSGVIESARGDAKAVIIDDISPISNGAVITNTSSCIRVNFHKTTDSNNFYVKWKMDAGEWVGWYPWYAPCILEGLTQGTHTFFAKIKDSYGNESAVVSRTFSISDHDAPHYVDAIGAQEGAVQTVSTFCIGVVYHDDITGNNYISLKSRLDDNPWSDWESTVTPCYHNVANGTHTFSSQARDRNGNESTVTTTHFSVQAPVLDTPPATPTQSPSATVTPLPTPLISISIGL